MVLLSSGRVGRRLPSRPPSFIWWGSFFWDPSGTLPLLWVAGAAKTMSWVFFLILIAAPAVLQYLDAFLQGPHHLFGGGLFFGTHPGLSHCCGWQGRQKQCLGVFLDFDCLPCRSSILRRLPSRPPSFSWWGSFFVWPLPSVSAPPCADHRGGPLPSLIFFLPYGPKRADLTGFVSVRSLVNRSYTVYFFPDRHLLHLTKE